MPHKVTPKKKRKENGKAGRYLFRMIPPLYCFDFATGQGKKKKRERKGETSILTVSQVSSDTFCCDY